MEEEGWRRWLTDWWKLNRMQSLGGGAPDEAEAGPEGIPRRRWRKQRVKIRGSSLVTSTSLH